MKPNPKPEPKPEFIDGGTVLISDEGWGGLTGDGGSAGIDPYVS